MTLEIISRQDRSKLVPLKNLERKTIFRRQTKKAWFIRVYDPIAKQLRSLSLSSGTLFDISEDEFVIPTPARLVEI